MFCLGKTDVGMKRTVNQDSFKITEFNSTTVLAVVCDGMGGAAGGGVAGTLAAETFTEYVKDHSKDICKKKTLTRLDEGRIRSILKAAAEQANQAVYNKATEDLSLHGMGTTLVAALICCGTIFTVNVGDSRMYLISDESIRQITHDHSYVQFLIDTGRLSEEEARKSHNRNIITRAVGTDTTVEADVFVNRATDGNYILLCSDGLVNHVSPDTIFKTVYSTEETVGEAMLDECVDTLILAANTAGGSDNITAVMIAL
ncbi:MAG: Stp1/IreP family PP2C-type Ser/Thr phosphatase [Clostridia bacterium]|nr:Stp1/IreP family PP2C-type Ser/Thr phosphatase [Clostridia bacterium]